MYLNSELYLFPPFHGIVTIIIPKTIKMQGPQIELFWKGPQIEFFWKGPQIELFGKGPQIEICFKTELKIGSENIYFIFQRYRFLSH